MTRWARSIPTSVMITPLEIRTPGVLTSYLSTPSGLGPFPNWIDLLLSTKSMVLLDTIQLSGAWIRMKDVVELMFVGQLRVLELGYDYFGTHFLFRPPPEHSPRTSPLLSLDLGYMPLFGNMLELILAWPRALKRLRCALVCIRRPAVDPVPDVSAEPTKPEDPTEDLTPDDPTRQPISPALVVSSLESTKHSLVKLELLEFVEGWDTHHGSKLDLSEFSSLEVLKMPEICFSTLKDWWNNTPNGDVGVYKLLPRSLRQLKVVFAADKYMFRRNENWLVELAERQPEHLPNLERVSLRIKLDAFEDRDLDLAPHQSLADAMEAALFRFSVEYIGKETEFFWDKFPTTDVFLT